MQEKPGRPQAKKPEEPLSRDERLKAALKANMARRKAQARARAASGADENTETGEE